MYSQITEVKGIQSLAPRNHVQVHLETGKMTNNVEEIVFVEYEELTESL